MRRHKKLYTRLFKKTYRHRPNSRREYVRTRKRTRARRLNRALREVVQRPTDATLLSPLSEYEQDLIQRGVLY